MSHVLFTQIGRPREVENNEYSTTIYQLGNKTFETAMISFGLAELLKPEQLILLGTTGSSWSSLISMHPTLLESADAIDLHDKLVTMQSNDNLTDNDIVPLGDILSEQLGRSVTCCITPYLEQETISESAQYMRILARHVEKGDEITLDITHGLRHHPMLVVVAALYLRKTLSATINAIYYGMFERQVDGITPVVSLEGMLNLLDWVTALDSFDKDGDYSIFANLMELDGVEPALFKSIELAGFHERNINSVQAREQLTPLRQASFSATDTPLTHLFSDALKERVAWSSSGGRGEREIQLSRQYLERGDYLRSAIYALEGSISKGLDKQKLNLNDFDERKDYSDHDDRCKSFRELKRLRNAMAHGVPGSAETSRILKDKDELEKRLKELVKNLRSDC